MDKPLKSTVFCNSMFARRYWVHVEWPVWIADWPPHCKYFFHHKYYSCPIEPRIRKGKTLRHLRNFPGFLSSQSHCSRAGLRGWSAVMRGRPAMASRVSSHRPVCGGTDSDSSSESVCLFVCLFVCLSVSFFLSVFLSSFVFLFVCIGRWWWWWPNEDQMIWGKSSMLDACSTQVGGGC